MDTVLPPIEAGRHLCTLAYLVPVTGLTWLQLDRIAREHNVIAACTINGVPHFDEVGTGLIWEEIDKLKGNASRQPQVMTWTVPVSEVKPC